METRGKEREILETSSEENEQQRQEQVKEDNNTNSSISSAPKRSYECTFCKRGFTNAQALGGHMNIHRKDRAKVKQPTAPSMPSKLGEEYMNPRGYMSLVSCDQLGSRYNYPVLDAQRSDYQMYFPPSGSSPRQPYGYNFRGGDYLAAARPQSWMNVNNGHEEVWGANLSLRIQPEEIQESEVVSKEDEVDLELRLGHHDQ